MIKTPIQSFSSNKPTVSAIYIKNENIAIATLTILINDVAGFINVGKTMSVNQVEQTVYVLLKEFGYFKIDDFVICFANAKAGKYGKTFDRIDGMIISEWLTLYDNERSEQIEAFRANQNKNPNKYYSESNDSHREPKLLLNKANQKPIPMPDYVKEALKKIFNKSEQVKYNVTLSKQDVEHKLLLARWDKQFNNFYYSNKRIKSRNVKGYRFLFISNKWLSKEEFLNFKAQKNGTN